ncbi:MAG: PEP-CTERM sorting domain-containing protein, partial [Cyanobacteria bacterium J06648_11]
LVSSSVRACWFPLAIAAIATQPANAAILGTTGDVVIAPKPTSSAAYPEGSVIHVFEEATKIEFPAGVTPNLGSIPVGRIVDSYLFHFDPDARGTTTVSGTVTFSRPILGFITQSSRIKNSDSLFDAFPPEGRNRGLEQSDIDASILAVRQANIELALQASGRSIDQVRVLVAAPEPTSVAGLMMVGAAGAGAAVRRRRQQRLSGQNAD